MKVDLLDLESQNKLQEHSRGSPEFLTPNLRQIGVPELYIIGQLQTDSSTFIYIYVNSYFLSIFLVALKKYNFYFSWPF